MQAKVPPPMRGLSNHGTPSAMKGERRRANPGQFSRRRSLDEPPPQRRHNAQDQIGRDLAQERTGRCVRKVFCQWPRRRRASDGAACGIMLAPRWWRPLRRRLRKVRIA
jgi:hypothetical protein